MLGIFKKKPVVLTAPVEGRSLRMEDVPDPMFAKKMLGDGCAFRFNGDTVVAPCNAKVILFVSTKHAIGLEVNGIQILLHVGIDTATLQGQGFTALVSVGDRVKRGQPLLKLDREYLTSQNADLTTMMLITTKESKFDVHETGDVTLSTPVISFR
jgi:PTS system glucose-specific IIA component